MNATSKIDNARGLIREGLGVDGLACATTSFQADGMVLLHLLIEQAPGIPVLFVDTGYHFPEAYAYRDEMTARFKLNTVNLLPKLTVVEQESQFGILHQSVPAQCCQMRKVEPLFSGLSAYDAWFTALRRDQSPSRANLLTRADFQLHGGRHILKFSPLAEWSAADIEAYLQHHGIPKLPLYEQGYTSIGCAPCTSRPLDPDNPRSGRWAGQRHECGIHIPAP